MPINKKSANNQLLENIVNHLGVQETVNYCGQKSYFTAKPFEEVSKAIYDMGIKNIYLTRNSIIVAYNKEEIEIKMAELFN
ncbi:MAG: hypothetical protein PHN56_01940 [Candidatus Nanoarchaeia archaeon]|nr:hypothetical protein [Candidatus Nanoarchaeia archaeon]